jgi:hypothetical protein
MPVLSNFTVKHGSPVLLKHDGRLLDRGRVYEFVAPLATKERSLFDPSENEAVRPRLSVVIPGVGNSVSP